MTGAVGVLSVSVQDFQVPSPFLRTTGVVPRRGVGGGVCMFLCFGLVLVPPLKFERRYL